MFRLIHSIRPCSKRICGCYDRAVKLALYLPINKDDEKRNNKKIDDLHIVYNMCTQTQGWQGHLKSYNKDQPHN